MPKVSTKNCEQPSNQTTTQNIEPSNQKLDWLFGVRQFLTSTVYCRGWAFTNDSTEISHCAAPPRNPSRLVDVRPLARGDCTAVQHSTDFCTHLSGRRLRATGRRGNRLCTGLGLTLDESGY